MDTIIVIPSRIGSTRLKRKALEKIGGKPMIERVYQRAVESNLPTYVATDSHEIADVIFHAGGNVVMTDPDLPNGTCRVCSACMKLENKPKFVINLQGDMPFIDPDVLLTVAENLRTVESGIVTPITLVNKEVANSPGNVKVVTDNDGNALYFSRSLIPFGAEKYWYHIGVYGFHFETLQQYVSLEKTPLEEEEGLEQLRAMQNGIPIKTCVVDSRPVSVDLPEDLEKVQEQCNVGCSS